MSMVGGEDEIRTHGTIAGTHAFQACAFNHSATSPLPTSIASSPLLKGCYFHATITVVSQAVTSHNRGNA